MAIYKSRLFYLHKTEWILAITNCRLPCPALLESCKHSYSRLLENSITARLLFVYSVYIVRCVLRTHCCLCVRTLICLTFYLMLVVVGLLGTSLMYLLSLSCVNRYYIVSIFVIIQRTQCSIPNILSTLILSGISRIFLLLSSRGVIILPIYDKFYSPHIMLLLYPIISLSSLLRWQTWIW